MASKINNRVLKEGPVQDSPRSLRLKRLAFFDKNDGTKQIPKSSLVGDGEKSVSLKVAQSKEKDETHHKDQQIPSYSSAKNVSSRNSYSRGLYRNDEEKKSAPDSLVRNNKNDLDLGYGSTDFISKQNNHHLSSNHNKSNSDVHNNESNRDIRKECQGKNQNKQLHLLDAQFEEDYVGLNLSQPSKTLGSHGKESVINNVQSNIQQTFTHNKLQSEPGLDTMVRNIFDSPMRSINNESDLNESSASELNESFDKSNLETILGKDRFKRLLKNFDASDWATTDEESLPTPRAKALFNEEIQLDSLRPSNKPNCDHSPDDLSDVHSDNDSFFKTHVPPTNYLQSESDESFGHADDIIRNIKDKAKVALSSGNIFISDERNASYLKEKNSIPLQSNSFDADSDYTLENTKTDFTIEKDNTESYGDAIKKQNDGDRLQASELNVNQNNVPSYKLSPRNISKSLSSPRTSQNMYSLPSKEQHIQAIKEHIETRNLEIPKPLPPGVYTSPSLERYFSSLEKLNKEGSVFSSEEFDTIPEPTLIESCNDATFDTPVQNRRISKKKERVRQISTSSSKSSKSGSKSTLTLSKSSSQSELRNMKTVGDIVIEEDDDALTKVTGLVPGGEKVKHSRMLNNRQPNITKEAKETGRVITSDPLGEKDEGLLSLSSNRLEELKKLFKSSEEMPMRPAVDIIMCPDCKTLNKSYLQWCMECGATLPAVKMKPTTSSQSHEQYIQESPDKSLDNSRTANQQTLEVSQSNLSTSQRSSRFIENDLVVQKKSLATNLTKNSPEIFSDEESWATTKFSEVSGNPQGSSSKPVDKFRSRIADFIEDKVDLHEDIHTSQDYEEDQWNANEDSFDTSFRFEYNKQMSDSLSPKLSSSMKTKLSLDLTEPENNAVKISPQRESLVKQSEQLDFEYEDKKNPAKSLSEDLQRQLSIDLGKSLGTTEFLQDEAWAQHEVHKGYHSISEPQELSQDEDHQYRDENRSILDDELVTERLDDLEPNPKLLYKEITNAVEILLPNDDDEDEGDDRAKQEKYEMARSKTLKPGKSASGPMKSTSGPQESRKKGVRPSSASKSTSKSHSTDKVKSKVRASLEASGYQRRWEKSSTAWSSYNPGELKPRSSLKREILKPSNALIGVHSSNQENTEKEENVKRIPASSASSLRPSSAARNRPSSASILRPNQASGSRPNSSSGRPQSSSSVRPRPSSAVTRSGGPMATSQGTSKEKNAASRPSSSQSRHALRSLLPQQPDGDSPDFKNEEMVAQTSRGSARDSFVVKRATYKGGYNRVLSTRNTYNKYLEMSPRVNVGEVSMWQCLPDEILLEIFSLLRHSDLASCARVCTQFKRITDDDSLWREIVFRRRPYIKDDWLAHIGRRQPTSLSFIQCKGPGVTDKGLRELFRNCGESLEELNFTGCTRGHLVGDHILLHAASRCHNISKLNASWSNVSDNDLIAISEACDKLEVLCLDGLQSISDDAMHAVLIKHGIYLTELELFSCFQLTSRIVTDISQYCNSLYSLNLGQCWKLTDTSIINLAPHIKYVEKLDLRSIKQLKDDCIHQIVKNCVNLTSLSLANCSNITDAGLAEIASQARHLRSLDISSCRLISNQGVRNLAMGCSLLEFLDLSSTGVNHKAVTSLASYSNRHLQVLKLNFCKGITVSCLEKLARNCKSLSKLFLYGVSGLRAIDNVRLENSALWIEM